MRPVSPDPSLPDFPGKTWALGLLAIPLVRLLSYGWQPALRGQSAFVRDSDESMLPLMRRVLDGEGEHEGLSVVLATKGLGFEGFIVPTDVVPPVPEGASTK